MEELDFIIKHFDISLSESKEESVRQFLNSKDLDEEDLINLLESYEEFIINKL